MKPRGERRKRPAARSRGATGLRKTQATRRDDVAPALGNSGNRSFHLKIPNVLRAGGPSRVPGASDAVCGTRFQCKLNLTHPRQVMVSAADELAVGTGFSSKVCSSKTVPTDASPDSKCPICLDRFENVSYLDRCLHRFCFRCIQEWAKNKAECPLCKQPFYSILHSVQAEDNFQEFVLRPSENGSFGSPDGSRFRYRSTLTRERRSLLNSHHNNPSRTVSPPDNGILFEGLTGQPQRQQNDGIHEMIKRLASRRQASAEGRSMRQIQEQDIINFRRALYRSGVRVRGIQDGGRFRDISSEFYRRNPACLHRLVPWLKRELTVLFGAHGSLVNIVQHIIMSNVTRYDLESQAFAEDLRPFLLHRTDHFLHELISFARCPYNMEAYDQHSNYDCPAPSYEEGSHSDSTVITISPDVGEVADPDVSPSDLGVGQAPWDDETPGPSYSTLEPGPTTLSSLSVTSESSDEENSTSGAATQLEVKVDPGPKCEEVSPAPVDDCLIVGFVKPIAERTPELVELSSDSEGSLIEMKNEETKKPAHTQLNLFSESESNHSSAQSSTDSKSIADSSKDKEKLLESTRTSDIKNRKTDLQRVEEFLRSTLKNNRTNSHSNQEVLRKRSQSRSSESVPPTSHGRVHKQRRRHQSKERLRNKSSRSRERIRKKDKDTKRPRSRDRSLSMRSQTVSITSGSSKSRGRSRSKSCELQRSRSRDHDYDHPRENYRSSYQWEYTYYSRNRERGGYEQSYRSSRGQYHMTSPEYMIQSYTERKNTWGHKRGRQGGQQYNERHRSRSRSRSQSRTMSSGIDWTRSEKPSGKRKYKTRHLENQEVEGSQKDIVDVRGKENSPNMSSPLKYNNHHRNEGRKESRGNREAKHRRRKKTRSPSVEIVYEGKTTDIDKCRKKKKRKHKKKRRRHHRVHSATTSPVVITIDSDSDLGGNAQKENVLPNTCTTATSPMKGENCTTTTFDIVKPPDMYASLDEIDILGTDDDILDRDCENTTSSRHLDAATGILDDFHFDESSNDQPLGAMEESDSSQNSSVLGAFASSAEASQTGLLASPTALASSPVHAAASSPVHATASSPVHAAASSPVHAAASSPVHAAASSPVHAAASSPVHAAASSPMHDVAASPVHAAASPTTHAVVLSACNIVSQSVCTSDFPSTSESSHALPFTLSSRLSPVCLSPLVAASPPTHDLASKSQISEKNTSKKAPLLLTFPKSLMDTTYLFDQSDENT